MNHIGQVYEASLMDTLTIVRKRKLLAITAFLSVTCVSLAVLMALTPKYDATAILMVGADKTDRNLDTLHKNALTSLALIADSQEVVTGAIAGVGLQRLIGRQTGEVASWPTMRAQALNWLSDYTARIAGQANASLLRGSEDPLPTEEDSATRLLKRAVTRVNKALSIHVEPNSDLVTITFRHKDAATASAFANAIAAEAINKRLSVLDQPGAAIFFQLQTKRFEDEVKRAADDLRKFSTANHTYSADEQNTLLLRRANDLAAALVATHGMIADRTGRREALTAQLTRLKPVSQSPFVSSIINDLGSAQKTAPTIHENLPQSSEPPILMVKVYQDALVELLRVNAELEGLNKLEREQREQLAQANQELNDLAGKASEFARLQRAVDEATGSANSYARRTVEEKIASDLNLAKISPVKIVQHAVTPVEPAFPRYDLSLAGIFALSLAASVGAPFYAEVRSRKRPSRAAVETPPTWVEPAPKPPARPAGPALPRIRKDEV
jgi:uncharacterized protein involved in exopolysaccharide biosynthesis